MSFADHVLPGTATGDFDNAQYRRNRYRRHRDDGVDAGDVLAGVLVLGGILAIADAVYGDDDDRQPVRYERQDSIESAVANCRYEAGDGARVENVRRDGSGWTAEGVFAGGEAFFCRTDADGRVVEIDYADGYGSYGQSGQVGGYGDPTYGDTAYEDRQYDDATYYEARRRLGNAPVQDGYAAGPYPGGPVSDEDDYYYAEEDPYRDY